MVDCSNCSDRAFYSCTSCPLMVCEKHKSKHEQKKDGHRIDEIANIIVEIQRMSMQAVRNIKEKKMKLVNLLMNFQKK